MEWKKVGLMAIVGMLLVAALAESAGEGIHLLSDGVDKMNNYPRKMMKDSENQVEGCPRILEECTIDADCWEVCTEWNCLPNGFCG